MVTALELFHQTLLTLLPFLSLLPYWILINSTSKTSVPYGGL
jgi:hypothetical protein